MIEKYTKIMKIDRANMITWNGGKKVRKINRKYRQWQKRKMISQGGLQMK